MRVEQSEIVRVREREIEREERERGEKDRKREREILIERQIITFNSLCMAVNLTVYWRHRWNLNWTDVCESQTCKIKR